MPKRGGTCIRSRPLNVTRTIHQEPGSTPGIRLLLSVVQISVSGGVGQCAPKLQRRSRPPVRCAHNPLPHDSSCAWIDTCVNEFDQKVHFKCPYDGVLTGVKSEYSTTHRDRTFQFHCCQAYGRYTLTCKTTSEQNNWTGIFRTRLLQTTTWRELTVCMITLKRIVAGSLRSVDSTATTTTRNEKPFKASTSKIHFQF
ncbi:hypothetical protein OS493_032278 [Desmophyllum pertusum]|uniref:Uncharacterized protein n=1 Tax=Desmophyllum pertusum TaxID=174260 RepID=A0A9W9Z7V1_9CNID|nr:hypothetical protein OS493_032278 [Desmophyllum pertusum]